MTMTNNGSHALIGRRKRKYGCTIAAAALSLGCGAAGAAPIYSGAYADMYLKQNTFPTVLSEEKVYFDADLSSAITGHVGSQSDTRLVTLSSTTDVLDAANGYAAIGAEDGFLNSITITAPGYWFADLVFSVKLTPNANENLSVTATDKSGGTDTYVNWASQPDWVSGNNRILALSTGGNLLESVTITSTHGMDSLGGIDRFRQLEISGLQPVPVPAAMWLLGSGLLGLVGIARRKSAG